jgi:hypothetical protein
MEYRSRSMFFWLGLILIVLTNLDATKKILPLKKWHGVVNLVAAAMILVWGIRSGALAAGGGYAQ